LPAWARHAAAVVLPIANFVEEEGTVTNLRGRVQRFMQAKAAPGFARPSWYVLTDLLTATGKQTRHSLASEVFGALAAARSEFAGMSYDTLGLKGKAVAGATTGAPA
jgi:NADH-quinone oxidoreductase subunit G